MADRRDSPSPAPFVGQASPSETPRPSSDAQSPVRGLVGNTPEPELPAPERPWVPEVALPKGGGAIQAVGEKVEAQAFTGSASYSIALPTPSARGTGPGLSLSYGSGAGNGPFGVGWSLSIPSITRKTDRCLPEYADGRESDTFLLAGAEDLVPFADEDGERVVITQGDHRVYPYRPRVEGLFARIERWVLLENGNTHWRAITRDNVTSWYGRTEQARIVDPEDPRHVFSWLLEETRDDRGNITEYVYKAEDTSATGPTVAELNRSPVANRYPKRIRYGNQQPDVAEDFVFEVVFDYGEHGTVDGETGHVFVSPEEDRPWPARADAFSSFRSGFDVRTRRRCERVLVFHHMAELETTLGTGPTLVSSVDFTYDEATHLAKLVAFTRRNYVRDDANGYETAAFPTVRFTYSEAVIGQALETLDARTLAELPQGVDGNEFRFVDLDGEGLPGILAQLGDTLEYRRPEGNGRFGGLEVLRSQISGARLGENAELVDVDGDGRLELMIEGEGYHLRRASGEWAPFRAFEQVPNLSSTQQSHLRRIDLDGDGLPDFLITEGNHFVWIPSLGLRGYGRAESLPKPGDERAGPAVVFDDATGRIVFADMTGDGLQDIVRIEHGSVEYWPNRGHGEFGRRVTMDGETFFAARSDFDPARIRLADVDGSGTADILYLDDRGAQVWFNQSGNAFSAPVRITAFPGVSATTAVEVIDLLGKGTSCLVWSEASGWARPMTVRFVELIVEKPHLLTEVDNGTGLVTRLAYGSSAAEYLRDREAGRPWATRLPFPVHVVTRIENADLVARRRFVQHFAYHHGHYDGVEREFRGFAAVERWDTESFEELTGDGLFTFDLFDTVEENLHQPPVLTKTWFHTGVYMGGGAVSRQLAGEAWAGDPEAETWMLPDTVLPAGLSVDEAREACRALRGRTLREEVYALDGTEYEGFPYAVTEANFGVRRLQAKGKFKHAVFLVHDRENIASTYERITNDPRIAHTLVLEVDDYGNVTRQAAVAYPRRDPLVGMPEQGVRAVVVSEASFAAVDDRESEPDVYRASVPVEARSYELLGFDDTAPVAREALRTAVGAAVRDAPEAPAPEDELVHLRLLSAKRTLYYADDGTTPLSLGECGPRALVRELHGAAFSPGQVTTAYATDVDAVMLGAAGYVQDDGLWWARSGRPTYDATRFFLVTAVVDPFGNPPTTVDYDAYVLFATDVTDPIGNVSTAVYDYRVLAPRLLTDPNGCRTAVGFDTRGFVVWTAAMGREGASEGDTPESPTTTFAYDLFAWAEREEPNFSHAQMRETHGDPNTRWLQRRVYSDGAGQVLLEKADAEPGLAPERDENGELVLVNGEPALVLAEPRFVGTGRVVFDNKGNPVKQYEPYFSSTLAYESEAEVREQGVTPVLHYDPLGRLVRTDFPNGTFARTEFTPWSQTSFDTSDTVLESMWRVERIDYDGADPALVAERQAAEQSEAHADTPATQHLDPQGRAFLGVEHAGFEGSPPEPVLFETRVALDIVGNPLEVTDARGNTAATSSYGLLRQQLRTTSIDAGERRQLIDVMGAPHHAWSSRGFASSFRYDTARRPTHHFVQPQMGTPVLVTRTVYGEAVPNAPAQALRGRPYRVYDGAGVTTNVEHDFRGNLVHTTRNLTLAYDATPDWIALAELEDITDLELAAAAMLEAETLALHTTFDALGRPVTQTTPDASVVTLTYNEASLLEAVDANLRGANTSTPFVENIDYNARGQRERIEYGNGTTTHYEYDPQTFRLRRIRTVANGSTYQDLRYTYDPTGNITHIRDEAQQSLFFNGQFIEPLQRFTYDALYRLIEATGREHESLGQATNTDFAPLAHPQDGQALRNYTQGYSYDAVGNISQMAHTAANGNWTRNYEYANDGNHLLATSIPGQPNTLSDTYAYDAHGNMVAMPHLAAIDWDHADRMQHADLGGGGDVWFVYDGSGARVRKVQANQSGTQMRERIYFGPYELYRERQSGTLELERQTLHLSDDSGRIAIVETLTVDEGTPVVSPTPTQRYQYSNHLGSAALELDETANIISYEEYHPYGTTSYAANDSSIDVSPKRYRYIGQECDEGTGLYHLGARYYASWLGRWTAADPIGLGDGVNRYAYADNCPTSVHDTSGTHGERKVHYGGEHTSSIQSTEGDDQFTSDTPYFSTAAPWGSDRNPPPPPDLHPGVPQSIAEQARQGLLESGFYQFERSDGRNANLWVRHYERGKFEVVSWVDLPTDRATIEEHYGTSGNLTTILQQTFTTYNLRMNALVDAGFDPYTANAIAAQQGVEDVKMVIGAVMGILGGASAVSAVASIRAISTVTTAPGNRPPTTPPSGGGGARKGPIPDQPPENLTEQLTLAEARATPASATPAMTLLSDAPRLEANYGPGTWVKMEHVHQMPNNAGQINVHWFRNQSSGLNVEFKFKFRLRDKMGVKKPPKEPVSPTGTHGFP